MIEDFKEIQMTKYTGQTISCSINNYILEMNNRGEILIGFQNEERANIHFRVENGCALCPSVFAKYFMGKDKIQNNKSCINISKMTINNYTTENPRYLCHVPLHIIKKKYEKVDEFMKM